MKTALPGIPNMQTGEIAELYTITQSNGAVAYYTTFDVDVLYNGQTYLAGVINFDRGVIRCAVGIEVDDVTVTLYPGRDDLKTLPAFCNNGGLDGAWVKIERARQAYVVHLFEGMVSDAAGDRTKVELTISAGTLLLNIDMPRNVLTPGCTYTLFDAGCGLIKENFAHPSAVSDASVSRRLLPCGLIQATGYFDLGSVIFTSGANLGATRTIKQYTLGVIELSYPLQHVPEVGDTFTAYPGCDGRMTTCANTFANLPRYRGYPFIPIREDAI